MAQKNELPEPTGKRFVCGVCDPPKGFDTIEEYIEHKSEDPPGGHGIPKENICQVCGKDFKNIDGVRGHSKVHLSLARRAEGEGALGESATGTSAGRTEAEIYASLRLEGPTAFHPVLRERLLKLLDSVPDIVAKSKTFVLDEWDANPAVRLDFRGVEHLLYTGGVKPDKAVYIVNELIKLYNYYAGALQKEGYQITPVQLSSGSAWGSLTPGYGYTPQAAIGSGQGGGQPSGYQGQPWQSRDQQPLTEDRAYRLFKEWQDEQRGGSRTGRDPVATVEVAGPDGKTARFIATPDVLSNLQNMGLLPRPTNESQEAGVDVEGTVAAATKPLQDELGHYKERLADKEKETETLRVDHKEDLREQKEEYEKKIEDLKDELKEAKVDLKEMTKERDSYRDTSMRNELSKVNADTRSQDVESRLKDAEAERKALAAKVNQGEYNSDGTKLLANSLDKVAEKEPLKEIRQIVKEVLLPSQQPAAPRSSAVPGEEELEKEGLVAQS